MRVHIIRSQEVDDDKFIQILDLLNAVPGPVEFHIKDDAVVAFDPEEIRSNWIHNEEHFGKQKKLYYFTTSLSAEMPIKREELSWSSLFNKCDQYRIRHQLAPNEFVILLTDMANDKNWFASLDDQMPYNGFIHTDDWNHFIDCPEKFPIAYEVIALILQKHIFNGWADMRLKVHDRPIGCVSDMCINKKEVMLKLRTGDVCMDCMSELEKKIGIAEINHCLNIMEMLRERMMFVRNRKSYLGPSRLHISGKEIRLKDFNNAEIKLRPLEITLYLLFLKHPEGLYMSSLCDHKQELYDAYALISGKDDVQEMKHRIDDLANMLSESATQKISRIKKAFEEVIGSELAQHYIIKGPHGKEKKIALDRSFLMIADSNLH